MVDVIGTNADKSAKSRRGVGTEEERNCEAPAEILRAVDAIDAVGMAAEWVRCPSYSFLDRQEEAIAHLIRETIERAGLPAEWVEVAPGRPNVLTCLKGSGGGRSLLLVGHTDTVPAYGMAEPFGGEIRDGWLYGRGSCDMKGPLAAMLTAVIGLARSGVRLAGDVWFGGVIDEEERGQGIEHLAKHGPFTDGAVIGEPTGLRVAIGQKGLEWIRVVVEGRQVHGGRMEEGINAVVMASRLIGLIESEYAPRLAARTHPVLGRPTINIGRVEGGDQPSTVPGRCLIDLDRRWIPGESRQQVYGELKALIDQLHRQDGRFRATLGGIYEEGEVMPHCPFCTDVGDPLIQAARFATDGETGKAAAEAGVGVDSGWNVFPAWTDAGILANFTKTQCVILGPGDLALAHSSAERMDTEELKRAARIYARLAWQYCRNETKQTEGG